MTEEDGLYLVNRINNNRFKLSMERQQEGVEPFSGL
jgi:hypothetical protein